MVLSIMRCCFLIEDCPTDGYVLQEDMSYRRTFLTGGHFLQEDMSYMRICLTEEHVLFIYLSAIWHIQLKD